MSEIDRREVIGGAGASVATVVLPMYVPQTWCEGGYTPDVKWELSWWRPIVFECPEPWPEGRYAELWASHVVLPHVRR